MRVRGLLVVVLAFVFGGCALPRAFMPRENRNGTGPEGHPAAVYALGGVPPVGEVRLWSGGAERADGGVELHLGFELENTSAEPIALDLASLLCADVWVAGRPLAASVSPARLEGAAEAGPGGSAWLDAWFRLDAGRPRDVDAFTVRFRVLAGERELLAQATPFLPLVVDDGWRDEWFLWYGGYWGRPYGWWGPGYRYRWYYGPCL
ncbi:MAG: hypothetical protein KF830_06890 [Planctomycetes bacterium]|nr:hypothetical protein [Planctomycetota bacterium]